MGNFEDHIKYGIYAYPLTLALVISIAYFTSWSYTVTISILPIALLTTLIGAVLPDIDHHNSYPYQAVKRYLPLVISSGFLLLYTAQITTIHTILPSHQYKTITTTAFIGFIISIVLLFSSRKGISIARPPHRGITHSKLFLAATAILTVIITYASLSTTTLPTSTQQTSSISTALSFTIGMLAHHACDDILL